MTSSPLARIWSHAINALQRLRAALLPLDTLLAKELRDLSANLRALETYCRRVALTEALTLRPAILDRGPSGLPLGPTVQKGRLKARGPRGPSLRLWPRPGRISVRIKLLGPPTSMREIWRDQRRTALINRLRAARLHRKPQHLRLADRIDALQRFLDRPHAAIRRLARKLRQTPKLALKIAARRLRPSLHLSQDHIDENDNIMWPLVHDSS